MSGFNVTSARPVSCNPVLSRSIIAASCLLLVSTLANSQSFVVGNKGCPMAHCDQRMTGAVNQPVPPGPGISRFFQDNSGSGSGFGLGCTSNTKVVACTYQGLASPTLVVYNADGVKMWDSGFHLNGSASASAAIVADDGGIVAADSRNVVRFSPTGSVIWKKRFNGGLPISPNYTDNGAIVVAGSDGTIAAYRVSDGFAFTPIRLGDANGFFQTRNSPAVRGNRMYVSLDHEANENVGRLVAIDVNTSATNGVYLTVAWTHDFTGPSGGTPLIFGDTIIFDGASTNDTSTGATPFLRCVQDKGAAAVTLWTQIMPGPVKAAPTLDPRGGFWTFPARGSLMRFSTSPSSPTSSAPTLLQTIDLHALTGEAGTQSPSSAMVMADGLNGDPVMIVGIMSRPDGSGPTGASMVAAIDVKNTRLLWRDIVSPTSQTVVISQFVITKSNAQVGKYSVGFPEVFQGLRLVQ